MAGTSMASPFIAGAAAVLHQALDATGHHANANQDGILSLMRSTGANVSLVERLEDADIVLTDRAYYRRKPMSLKEAEARGIPIYVLKSNTLLQMEQALLTIYRQHSQGYQHDYAAAWQVLDVDMSGLPCGPKAAFATTGYFPKQRNRRGRQLGRVLATHYQEIVVDQLFDG